MVLTGSEPESCVTDMTNIHKLSVLLDDLVINFQAPTVDSWNPFKRRRQHEALQKWVNERPPSAGITGEELEKQYPGHPHRTRHIVGGVAGTIAGAAGGAAVASKLKSPHFIGHLVGGGAFLGGAAGTFASDPKHYVQDIKGHIADMERIDSAFKNQSVPVRSVKTPVPIATSHKEVAGELKGQGVGFIKRHAAALSTFPVRHSANAAFLPLGEKGVIVSGENAPASFIRHEAGHAKDYAHYGGEAGFQKAYPAYGQFTFPKKPYIHNTLLAEHRAWAHAGKLNKKDQEVRDAALRTYARGGMLLSANERLIQLSAGIKKCG